jgi:hypothetical protein
VVFEDHQGKTWLTVRQVGIPSGVMSDMAKAGWNESLDSSLNRRARGALSKTAHCRARQLIQDQTPLGDH